MESRGSAIFTIFAHQVVGHRVALYHIIDSLQTFVDVVLALRHRLDGFLYRVQLAVIVHQLERCLCAMS